MCLIITILFLIMGIQNLIEGYYNMAALQLLIALGFAFMLWRNIQLTRCERTGECSGCTLPNWLTKWFRKRDERSDNNNERVE